MNLNYDPVTNTVGKDIPFQRIRRITGYLVGDVSRFNNGKRAELNDRVKHIGNGGKKWLSTMDTQTTKHGQS